MHLMVGKGFPLSWQTCISKEGKGESGKDYKGRGEGVLGLLRIKEEGMRCNALKKESKMKG